MLFFLLWIIIPNMFSEQRLRWLPPARGQQPNCKEGMRKYIIQIRFEKQLIFQGILIRAPYMALKGLWTKNLTRIFKSPEMA